MTTEIKELSEKLAELYLVNAYVTRIVNGMGAHFEATHERVKIYLAADSGRISDLADDNGISMDIALHCVARKDRVFMVETLAEHKSLHDAARMARVRCLIAIGENK